MSHNAFKIREEDVGNERRSASRHGEYNTSPFSFLFFFQSKVYFFIGCLVYFSHTITYSVSRCHTRQKTSTNFCQLFTMARFFFFLLWASLDGINSWANLHQSQLGLHENGNEKKKKKKAHPKQCLTLNRINS